MIFSGSWTFLTVPFNVEKAYVDWIESVKKEKTRKRRITKAVELLSAGKKLK
jgi:uncharacterized protein YdeI (YjbR/CyaY-like superfamily)